MNMTLLTSATETIRKTWPTARPHLAMIMGSGWRDVTNGFTIKASIDYKNIPVLGAPGVEGHGGQLLLASHAEAELLIFAGRRHLYEGVPVETLAFPIHLSKSLGASGIILTNSAGGINPAFTPGGIMIINDHINLMGSNPLIGPHNQFLGPRFPDMSRLYDPDYRDLLIHCAKESNIAVSQGVYLAVSGPSYETPAEIATFRKLGADAIGMSTVPEAILAHAAGLRVAGLSCITNSAAGISQSLSHAEVLSNAKASIPALTRLLQTFISKSH
jgi:purine-nucleoside phosphorylase